MPDAQVDIDRNTTGDALLFLLFFFNLYL